MKLCFIGDVVGQTGCEFFREKISWVKRQYGIDLVVANAENSAEGNGILPHSADFLFDSGADILTSGNHALKRREIYDYLDKNTGLIRPVNFHSSAPGFGYYIYDKIYYRVCVINLMGVVYMDNLKNPFDAIDELLEGVDAEIKVVDFHAEATSEKLAMGMYLDGRVSLVCGTHTHVQTADERIFPGGTGYITDAGMCGVFDSVLGAKPESAIRRLKTCLPTRLEPAEGRCVMSGIVAEIDPATGRTTDIQRINIT